MSAADRIPFDQLRRNLRWGVGLVLLADIALGVWLLSPQAPSVNATRQQLNAARGELARMQVESRQLGQLQNRVRLSREQMQELMAAGMPADGEAYHKLLGELQRLAVDSQAEFATQSFKPAPKPANGLRRIDMDLQVAGQYSAVVRFLNAVERSPMFFIIDQVSVTGGSRPTAADAFSGPEPVKLDVKVEAYVQILPAASPAPAADAGGNR